MKIGIDIDTIRDVNSQAVKYYKRDINPQFVMKDGVFPKDINIDKDLDFKTKKEKIDFFNVDYSYEIYGMASLFSRNLSVNLNKWINDIRGEYISFSEEKKSLFSKLFKKKKKCNFDVERIDVSLFGIMASEPIIGFTYFFLSKIASRCREVFFPIDSDDVFKRCNVVVTSDPKMIRKSGDDTFLIVIKRKYNERLCKKADIVYDDIDDMFKDEKLIEKIKNSYVL